MLTRHMMDIKKIKEYNNETKNWCEYLRETWERSIEELLFKKTIVRYRPSVETQRLSAIKYSDDTLTLIDRGMTETSNFLHDRSAAEGELFEEPSFFEEMLDDLKVFYDEQK